MRSAPPIPDAPADRLDARIVQQAVDWLVRLQCGADEAERADCQRWRAGHPDHERAWQRVSALELGMQARREQLDGGVAGQAIESVLRGARRRRAVTGLLGLGGLALLTWQGARVEGEWTAWRAEQRTRTGEQRRIELADGTRVMLNTATALDVRFDAQARRLLLRRGEIIVETAVDAAGRPLIVETGDGRIVPVGTRFTVRHDAPSAGTTRVQVLSGAVELYPGLAGETGRTRLAAGQETAFGRVAVEAALPLRADAAAWTDGILAADDMRLATFVAELGRYRPGFLRCDPTVAELRVTGSFPLRDTDRALDSLSRVLPVRVVRRGAYWVTVAPA